MRIRKWRKMFQVIAPLLIIVALTMNLIFTFNALNREVQPTGSMNDPNIPSKTIKGSESKSDEKVWNVNHHSLREAIMSHVGQEVVKVAAKSLSARTVKYVHFTYSDPKAYQGPIVDGWPPGKERNLPRYLNGKERPFLIQPNEGRNVSGDVLFMIHSSPEKMSMRDGVRKTWFFYQSICKTRMTALFIVGLHKDPSINQRVRDEAETYGDIVQANFDDHYNNLTIKSLFCFKYAIETKWIKPPEFLFKVDDDSFVNVAHLEELLNKLGSNPKKLLIGHLLPNNPLPKLVLPAEKDNNFTKKWVSPSYMFNGPVYPPFVSGSGYFMSMDAVHCIYNEVLKLPFFHLEDVLITGFGAQNCNITLTDSNQFFAGPPLVSDIVSDDIMVHYTNSYTKNILLKMALFDFLQAKYNALIAQLGSKTDEKPWNLPSNYYFNTTMFQEEYVGRIPKAELE
ncbi:hypothetical protein TCAL_10002, partial [Tigriopus californicus]